jgi:hypothetical protein
MDTDIPSVLIHKALIDILNKYLPDIKLSNIKNNKKKILKCLLDICTSHKLLNQKARLTNNFLCSRLSTCMIDNAVEKETKDYENFSYMGALNPNPIYIKHAINRLEKNTTKNFGLILNTHIIGEGNHWVAIYVLLRKKAQYKY